MNDLFDLQLSDYSYALPENRIARFPVEPRDSSKLLAYRKGQISHHTFTDLPSLLPANSFLVFNNTKVIPARLHFRKPSGALIEVFLLNPIEPTTFIHEAMQLTGSCVWHCMIGNKKKWTKGEILNSECSVSNTKRAITAELIDTEKSWVRFDIETSALNFPVFSGEGTYAMTFLDIIKAFGQIPLPPYLKRKAEAQDSITYQTVYSKQEGAVAAPTAGLHFTDDIFEKLAERNIKHDFVTLHVGAGTFQPVNVQRVAEHTMHAEQVVYTKFLIQNLLIEINNIVAVGTTSMRSLESLYWAGVKLIQKANHTFIEKLFPYQHQTTPTPSESLDAILGYLNENNLTELVCETEIMIMPSYQFKLCKGLITNYHQPESTLILLVAALVGEDWRKIYSEALQNDYRFLSYGDSSLLLP